MSVNTSVLCSGTVHHVCLIPPEKVVPGTVPGHGTDKMCRQPCPDTHGPCLRPTSSPKTRWCVVVDDDPYATKTWLSTVDGSWKVDQMIVVGVSAPVRPH